METFISNYYCCPFCSKKYKHGSDVVVLNTDNCFLTPCKPNIAQKKVNIGYARWVGHNMIKLVFNPFKFESDRIKVLERDNNICYWCGGFGTTVDHLIPKSKGGPPTLDNLVCSCYECNTDKADSLPDTYRRKVTDDESIDRMPSQESSMDSPSLSGKVERDERIYTINQTPYFS